MLGGREGERRSGERERGGDLCNTMCVSLTLTHYALQAVSPPHPLIYMPSQISRMGVKWRV